MKLTLNEKRIIFQILIYIIKADLVEDSNEIRFLDKVFHDFEFSISEFDHMELMDLDYLKRTFATFQDEKKLMQENCFTTWRNVMAMSTQGSWRYSSECSLLG